MLKHFQHMIFKTNKPWSSHPSSLLILPHHGLPWPESCFPQSYTQIQHRAKSKNAGGRMRRSAVPWQLWCVHWTWWMVHSTSPSFCPFTWKVESVNCTARFLLWHFTWPSGRAGHPFISPVSIYTAAEGWVWSIQLMQTCHPSSYSQARIPRS